MNVKHPDGKQIIVMVSGSPIVTSTECFKDFGDVDDCIWVSISNFGSSNNLLIDLTEWDAFVSLIKETDEIVQGLKKESEK